MSDTLLVCRDLSQEVIAETGEKLKARLLSNCHT
jgi:hypothetical protein